MNGWSKEQERLMAEWSDLAMCYRWLHDKSEKFFHSKTLWINLPVIILTTLGGTANFGIQSLFSDETSKQYASFAIGGISLFAGLLTTIGNYLRYAQLEEAHRVASIAWGKFQRLIAVELAMKPDDRMDSLDFLKICRADLDRLIEQSPPIPEKTISMFEEEFGSITDLKKPDICGALEHTRVFESSEVRLKQVATEAALMLRHKKKALNELMSPQIQDTIKAQIDTKLADAIEQRKKDLEAEIEAQRVSALEAEENFKRMMEEREKKMEAEIEAAIEAKKKKMVPLNGAVALGMPLGMVKPRGSAFESRMQFKQNPLFVSGKLPKIQLPDVLSAEEKTTDAPILAPLPTSSSPRKSVTLKNIVVIPSSQQPDKAQLDASAE